MAEIYKYHLFFCTHLREDGSQSCAQDNAQALRDYAKQRVKALNIAKVRVNNAGCLNRCKLGPIMVVYPEGVWYQYHDKADIDEIIDSHLLQGKIVKRLLK